MTINEFISGITTNISNKTQRNSITQQIVGGAFVDLATIVDSIIEGTPDPNLFINLNTIGYTVSGQTGNYHTKGFGVADTGFIAGNFPTDYGISATTSVLPNQIQITSIPDDYVLQLTGNGILFANARNSDIDVRFNLVTALSGNTISGATTSFISGLRSEISPTGATDVIRLQDLSGETLQTITNRDGVTTDQIDIGGLKITSTLSASLSGVSSINIFGTSYEAPGYGASNPSITSWLPQVKNVTGWVINNQGVSGAFICDQAPYIYSTSVYSNTLTIYGLGVNDRDFYYSASTKQAIFANEHLATVAYLAIPDRKKILATGAVTYTGTWNSGFYAISKSTTTNGATATFSVTGTEIIVSTTVGDTLSGTFTITIDGVLQGTYSNATASPMITNNGSGINRGPSCQIYTGLTNTTHTVVITNTSTNAFYFDWAVGIDNNINGPSVYVTNLVYQNSIGNVYPIDNPNVDSYNANIVSNINQLAGYGLNVKLIDINSIIDPLTDIGAYGIHPNDLGYAKITTRVLSTIDSTYYNINGNVDSLIGNSPSGIYNYLKNTYAGSESTIGFQLQNDDSSTAWIYRTSSVSTDKTSNTLYITNNSVSNNTPINSDIVLMNSSLETLRLTNGNIKVNNFTKTGIVTNNTSGILSSTSLLTSVLGGSGIANNGTLNWGSGGVLGTNAYTSTAFLPVANGIFTGILTGPTALISQNTIGAMQAFGSGTTTYIGNSSSGGAAYPFTANNHLVLQARNNGSDIVFGCGISSVVAPRLVIRGLTGNIDIGNPTSTDLGANFSIAQSTVGIGTVTNTASGVTVTGTNTQFINTFKIGDTITISGETRTISAITSNTSMSTNAWTAAHTTAAYTLVGGTRFQVFGNGNVSIPGTGTTTTQLSTDNSNKIATTAFVKNNISIISKMVNTYALMIADGTPLITTNYKVLVDENKSKNNTIYHWYPDGKRIFTTTTEDN